MTPADVSVTQHFVDLPSLRMHYVSKGTGPVVLLLHGFPESWWSWRYQLEPLAQAGYRVIAPDLRGYGETDKQGPYDLDTLTTDVCELVASLGVQRVKLVGHDWGGALAWHLASHRPEVCEHLTVLNCPHPVRLREALLSRPSWAQLKKSWYMFFFQLPSLPEYLLTKNDAGNLVRLVRASAVDRSRCTPEELRPFRDAIQAPQAAKAMVGWYRAAFSAGFSPFRAAPNYPRISCPTQLIWGMADPALGYADVVPGTERFVDALTIDQVPGCGHFVHAEQPAQVNALLLHFFKEHP
jgi:pimeloyl-ACP methyl ester carboxylesterase